MGYIRKDGVIQFEGQDEQGNPVYSRVCQDFCVTKKYSNVNTKEQTIEIGFVDSVGEYVEVAVKRSDCVGKCPSALTDKDFFINDYYIRYFFDIIQTF